MKVLVVATREPDGGTEIDVFVDGARIPDEDLDLVHVDAGRGYDWEDWAEHRDSGWTGPPGSTARGRSPRWSWRSMTRRAGSTSSTGRKARSGCDRLLALRDSRGTGGMGLPIP
jgi:hypothetical protein